MTWPTLSSQSPRDIQAEGVIASWSPLGGWLRVVLVAVYLATLGLAARLLVMIEDTSMMPWYLALLAAFFILFSLVWIRPGLGPLLLHPILVIQSLIVLALLMFEPEYDSVTGLFVPLSYQAALVFRGRVRWIWVGALVVLIAGSLMITLGPARGLGAALTPMVVAIAFPALAMASQDIEMARAKSQRMVGELKATHARLEKYAAEVQELAAVEERNRLARELHDSVSQAMFGILLSTRSAQIMLKKDPDAVKAQLEQLEGLTREALARMRGFIADLRPKVE